MGPHRATAAQDRFRRCFRRSELVERPHRRSNQGPGAAPEVMGDDGESRRGPNLTRCGGPRQAVIHRSGTLSPGTRPGRCGGGLTLWKTVAYRWPVTCRGAAHAVPSGALERRAPRCPADSDVGPIAGLDPPERSCEQAYVPAEQPPPPQGARFPPADAYPRGPLDLLGASSQGPQQARRLSRRVRHRRHNRTGVLPAAARLTSGESFRRWVREGRRAGQPHPRPAPRPARP